MKYSYIMWADNEASDVIRFAPFILVTFIILAGLDLTSFTFEEKRISVSRRGKI